MANRILIVEDEAYIAFDLKMRLKLRGYEILDIISTGEDLFIMKGMTR